jgi:KDO2-lipid IV(A) lauroyltransferase
MNLLKDGCSIAMMIDQRVSEGKLLPFFNYDAFTSTLPSQLALKYDCEIIPIYFSRKVDGKFEMEILEPLSLPSNNNLEQIKIETSKKLNIYLEKMILKDPSQWILTHNRWK